MMGSTYGEVMESSTLEWRWSYGRRIFRLELCCNDARPFRWLTGSVHCGNARGMVFEKGDVVHLDWASMTVFDKVTGHSSPVTRIQQGAGPVSSSMKDMLGVASRVGPSQGSWGFSKRSARAVEPTTVGVQHITLSQDIEERDGALINLLVHGTPPAPVSFRNQPRYFYDFSRGGVARGQ